jgi:hypothetical protein
VEKRTRSPNYPALSLREAIEKVSILYQNQHTHSAPREVAVKSMGYGGLNGASATAISALHKYGLLDRIGDEVKISERAMRILHPTQPSEKALALKEAADSPELFRELAEKFPGQLPAEEVLRNYLVRRGFAPKALPEVVRGYRETMELVEGLRGAYDSLPAITGSANMMVEAATAKATGVVGKHPQIQEDERDIGRWNLEGGGHVRIVASTEVDTEAAIEWARFLLEAKEKELKRRTATGGDKAPKKAEGGDKDA